MMLSVVVGLALACLHVVTNAMGPVPPWLDYTTSALMIAAPSALIGLDRLRRPFGRALMLVAVLWCAVFIAGWFMWTLGFGRPPEILPPLALMFMGIGMVAILFGCVGGLIALASRAIVSYRSSHP